MSLLPHRIALLGLLCLYCSCAPAQHIMRGLEIGPWAGASLYFGDLNTDFRLNRPNLAGGFAARYNFNHRLAARISLNYGHLEAYDSDSDNPFERNRNLDFRTDIYDGTAQFEFNFLPYIHGSREYYFTPYAFAGVSVFNYNPRTDIDGQTVELREFGTEGQMNGEEYLTLASALTAGLGIRYDLSYELSLDVHFGLRNANTDYLDDVSTSYPDRTDLIRSRGPLAYALSDRSLLLDTEGNRFDRQGEQRGDDTRKDRYLFLGIGINYYFGDVRCPDLSRRRRRR